MRVLVAYDGSKCAGAAIQNLRRAGLPPEAGALVLCVADGRLAPSLDIGVSDAGFGGSCTERMAETDGAAEEAASRLRSYFPKWKVSTQTLWGAPAEVILETAARWRPDLLVAGSHGRSRAGRLFLGSVSVELIHKAPCSVRVSRADGPCGTGPIHIVVGTDGSTEADAVIRELAGRSWPEKTEAHIVSVVEALAPVPAPMEASTYAHEPAFSVMREADERERANMRDDAETAADRLRRAGLTVEATVADGVPGEAILAEADRWNADAVFVGARGLGRIERFLLGSVSTYVLTHARCTVEVVRRTD